ncbi:vesicular inhibitory amino acid transporter-like [Porites lutea]|uniref:vesicular inhibitory amino acid transporter-like n=1 Tax=Porites lutea TaxID=51062 RepID=UPI003CC68C54
MTKATHSKGYHLLRSNPTLADKLDEPPESITEEDSAEDEAPTTDKSPLWKAVVNLMSDIEGTGLLALPYVIAQSGLVAIAAMAVVPFIAFYTGTILIDCLYDKNDTGERVRVRSNYKQLGEACSPRFGGTTVSAIQLVDLFLLASLYLVLCASLSTGIFPDLPLSDKVWMLIAAALGLPTLFVKNLSQVAWMSLLSVIALMIAVVSVLAYGIAHESSWTPREILVWNIDEVPVSLAIIIFSYLCHPVLPGVEASIENKSKYRTMLALSYFFVAIVKVAFSVCAFLSFSSHIQDVIVNSLPVGVIRSLVNAFLLLNVFFSYPFRVITIIQTIEESVSPDSFSCKIPDLVWFIGIRVSTNFLTLLPAILIPHFALFMAFISSLTGSAIAFILPVIFHLVIKQHELKLYHYIFDISVLIFGFLAAALGLVYSGKSLFEELFHHRSNK